MKKALRVIALSLSLVLIFLMMAATLTACGDDNTDDGVTDGTGNGDTDNGGTQDGGGSNNGGNTSTDTAKLPYTVKVKTAGGMPLAGVVITVYSDATLEDLEGYATTNDDGIASLSMKENAGYAIKLSGVPEGYEVKDSYGFVSRHADITLTSSVISNESLNGITYKLGSIMRDFKLTSIDGKEVRLSELLKTKKAVMLNFWYTTCSWCIEEFPDMQSSYERYSEDVAILGLNPTGETASAIDLFRNTYGLTFDMFDERLGIGNAFGVNAFPTSVVIDRYGAVCLIVEGAISGEKYFDAIFEYFTADSYEQKLLESYEDMAPKEKPTEPMAPSEDISAALGSSELDITYYPEEGTADAEFSWPFVITEKDGITCIKPSNSFKDSSYATIHADVTLRRGEALAFDYYASCELGADLLYVLVDGVSINTISGDGKEWETCYSYVATKDGEYKLTLIYLKDSSEDVGDDTIYLSNVRIVNSEDVDEPTYIARWAATDPREDGDGYESYVDVILGSDGYYHVGSENGPLLLANLMGVTPFSDSDSVYSLLEKDYMRGDGLTSAYDVLIKYCNYASNAKIEGLCTVDETLKYYLNRVAILHGLGYTENQWLQFCIYYDSYGTDGAELDDPIKGLAPHSAFDTVVNAETGLDEYPNIVTYDRLIMPRGLWYKFTPEKSGAYYIASNVSKEKKDESLSAWIFLEDQTLFYEYSIRDRLVDNSNNVYMYVYLEAGKDYYIDIAYDDVYKVGSFGFKIEYLGETYKHLTAVSPGAPFTYEVEENGEISNTLIAGGTKVALGEDGYYHNVLPTGELGDSLIYADFSMFTSLFQNKNLETMIEMGAFNFSVDEDGQPARGEDMTERARYYLSLMITEGELEIRGCVAVNEELGQILTMLIDKYVFKNVENSFVKLCYYYETLDENWQFQSDF